MAANNTTRSTSRRWHYIVPEIPQQFAAAVRRKWTSSQYGNPSRQLVAGCGLLQQLHPSRHGMENKHCRPIRRHGQRRTVYPTHQIFTNCNRHFITHRFRPLPAFIDQTWFLLSFLNEEVTVFIDKMLSCTVRFYFLNTQNFFNRIWFHWIVDSVITDFVIHKHRHMVIQPVWIVSWSGHN